MSVRQQTARIDADPAPPLNISFTTDPLAGSGVILVCCSDVNSTGKFGTISDNQGVGNTWVQAVAKTDTVSGAAQIFFCPSIGAVTHPFTATVTFANTQFASGAMMEVTGGLTNPADATGSFSTTTSSTSATVTNSSANTTSDIVVAAIAANKPATTNIGLSDPATSGYTSLFVSQDVNDIGGFQASYKTDSSGNTDAASWTWTVASAGVAAVIANFAATLGTTIIPSAGSAAFTGHAPTVANSGSSNITPPAGSLAFTGHAAALLLATLTTPNAGSLAFTGHAPTINASGNLSIVPPAGSAAFTGNAPTVQSSGNVSITPNAGSLAFTGSVASQTLTLPPPASGTLSFTGNAPTVAIGGPMAITPNAGSLALTGHAPTVSATGNVTLTPNVGSLAFTGFAPSLLTPLALTPNAGSMAFTGYAPTVNAGGSISISPPAGSLAFTGYAPLISGPVALIPVAGTLSFTGHAPSISNPLPAVVCAGGTFDDLTPMPGLML